MSVVKKKSEGLVNEFTVTVPLEDIHGRIKNWLSERAKNIRMDGFRPGKVPLALIESQYKDEARRSVIGVIIDEKTREIIKENKLRPAVDPVYSVSKDEENSAFEFNVTFENFPEIELKDFKKLEFDVLSSPITATEVDKDIERIAELVPNFTDAPKDYKAKKKDLVEFTLETFVQEKLNKDYCGDNNRAVVGKDDFGFVEINNALEGAKAGDTVSVDTKFPKDYNDSKVAGKDVTFKMEVTRVRTPEKNEINDEFAVRVGYKTLAELQDARLNYLQEERNRLIRFYHKRKVLDALAKEYTFDVPSRMVQGEFDAIWTRLKEEMEQAKKDGNLDKEDANRPEEELRKEYMDIAARRVRLGILISDIALKNNISVTDQMLAKLVWDEAARYPGQEQQVIDYYRRNHQAQDQLRSPALEELVITFILDEAKTKELKLSYSELKKYLQEVIPGFDEDENIADNKQETKAEKSAKENVKAPAKKKASSKE
jgi:trigger factor